MPYQTINGITTWVNWTAGFQNITNSTSPWASLNNAVFGQLPWFWPVFPFVLYIWLFVEFSDSPGAGKIYMIAALVFVISSFLALGGYVPDAVINFVIFIVAFFLSKLFRGPSTVSG